MSPARRRVDRADSARPALGRSRVGRRAYLQSARFDTYLAAAQRLLDGDMRTSASAPPTRCGSGNEQATREGRAPGYDGRLPRSHAGRASVAHRGREPAIDSFPHARRGTEHVRRRRPGEVSVEWSTISIS